MKAKLLDMLVRYSYQRRARADFVLSSGQRSNYYIDCKATTMRAEAMPLVARAFWPLLPPDVDAVGGLTLGADAIAGAIAFHSTSAGRPIDSFTVRKAPKQHGLMKFIEGCAQPGRRVAILDDVVTTGGSTIEAIRKCREAGIEVAAVAVLVDRQESREDGLSGLEAVKREAGPGVPVRTVFTRADLEARWQALQAGRAASPRRAAAR